MQTYSQLKEIVLAFVTAIDLMNPILKHHHRRTAIIAYHLARALKFSAKDMVHLITAAALHDIGALSVQDAVQLSHIDVHDPDPHQRLGAL